MVKRISFAALAATFLAACSPVGLVNTLVPREGLVQEREVAYGKHPRQVLDVYRPAEAGGAPRPVVVFFYGGSWEGGNRGSYLFVAQALASRGFVAVVPDYRVYPEVRFPAFLEDGAAAVAWTKANASRFGGDPGKVFVMGHSAGAHVAAMLALDPQWLATQELRPSDLAGLIGLAGPYDFLPLTNATLREIFAPQATISRTQPINFITRGAPRTLLATGTTDVSVSPGNSERLAKKLREVGTEVTELRYPELGHVAIVGVLAAPFQGRSPLLDEIERFVKR